MPNPYYEPEKLGLEQVLYIEDPNLYYEFDMFIVWKDKDGVYYWAQDSGCSCPSPFEDYYSLADLEHGDIHRAREAAVAYVAEATRSQWVSRSMTAREVRRALA